MPASPSPGPGQERRTLLAELTALEAPPHDGGLGDLLRAALIERIENKLTTLEDPDA